MSANPQLAQIRKELLRYLLLQVKQRQLDVGLVKEFIEAINEADSERDEPIAVVGMACRFPDAPDKERFWNNLVEGRESIGDFPPLRVDDLRRVEGGSAPVRRGGYLDRVDLFDPEYFGIPPHVARQLDPYHRNLMEVLVETMEDAGYSRAALHGAKVGVFVGNDHTHRLITSYLPFLSDFDFGAVSGSWSGILASRLSYHLNLRGPASVVDTGCSSALVALDAAVKAIRQGDCESAFVAAVNLFLSPSNLGNETESTDFRVRPFDVAANGTVWSEGVAGVYVKPLSRATADGDHVYGTILATAVNNDGRSNGLTAPNAQAQRDLLVSAWNRAGIPPESLSYVEAHGTGTALGDPIEIKGLTSAFGQFTTKRQFCGLGSVKSNIGHTVGVAGLASLIKTLLSLEQAVLPPSLHFDVPNRHLDLAESPVYVNDRLSEWPPAETPRRAGVSSFSLSGTNCHVVLEQAPAPTERPGPGPDGRLYPISARNPNLLARTAAQQLMFLDRHPDYRLDDVCFTMQVGRDHQPTRAVILCDSRETLREGLMQLVYPPKESPGSPPAAGPVVLWAGFGTPAPDHRAQDRGDVSAAAAGTGMDRRLDLPDRFQPLGEAVEDFLDGRDQVFVQRCRDADAQRVPLPPQLFDHVRLWDETVRRSEAAAGSEPTADAGDRLRRSLAEPSRLDGEDESAPRRVIAWVWSEVLGYPTIRGTDDFFALGGDSVSSLKITQLLNAGLGLDVPAPTLLAKPVFDDFAAAVTEDFGLGPERLPSPSGRPVGALAETSAAEGYELPLTASQRSMFLSSQLSGDSVAYNVTGLTLRQGTLDLARLEAGLDRLVRRHDSLRSTFHLVHGQPLQRVHPEVPVAVDHRRLSAPCDGESHEGLAQGLMRDFVQPFRLDESPLFRLAYVEFDDGVSCIAIDIHHIITDGASMGVLFRDLNTLFAGGAPPALQRSYRSAVRELLQRQNEFDQRPHRDYWMSQFADEVPILELPTDWQRPQVASGSGAKVFAAVDGSLLQEVKNYARERNLTLSMVLLGAFHQLLSRMSGQADLVIGTPVVGRPDLTFADLVGMFVNTLPLRITGDPLAVVGDFWTGLRSTVLEAFAHQDHPFESLVEELDPPREPGRRPVFDVYFVHQNVDMGLEHADEQVVPFDDGSAKYDLTLSTRESDGELLVEWEYSTDLFREDTVRLWAERYVRLLTSVVAATDDVRLGSLDILPPREVELIRQFATGPAPSTQTLGVVGLFERQVAAGPDRTALIHDDERMSYGELDARANQVARFLLAQGVEPGAPVALLLDRSFEMVTAILGVLKARGVYLPLNTGFPGERLRMMVDDAAPGVLLTAGTRTAQAADLASDGLRVVDLATCRELTDPGDGPLLPSSSDDPAYVMYTSGTTGRPKGSLIRQRGVLRVAHQAGFADADADDIFLMLSDYSFDGSVYDLFGALTNGASLVITDKETALDLDRLAAVIERHGVTRFFVTTALFNALIDIAPHALGGIRRIIFGGEAASPVHVDKAFQLLGPGRIANGYGPTETTVFASVYVFDSFNERDAVPIGRPISHTSLWVLDEDRELQPVGARGELYIGGAGLADGYLNQPELTAERFCTSPAVPGERLYRTGDLVTVKSNGLLYYHARIDQQVKLRGYRVELAEIVQVAVAEPYVRWAYAGTDKAIADTRTLCLWVQYADGADHESELRAALQRRLPSYMVPPSIITTDEVRLTRNGKVDVAALPRPGSATRAVATGPATTVQEQIAAVWSAVLGLAVTDIDANFFVLGGDSIKAIQIVAKLKEHGIAMQVSDLLEHQTIRVLAEAAERPRARREPLVDDEVPVSGPIIGSPIQQAFLDDPDGRGRVFTQCLLVKLAEPPDLDRLRRGLDRLTRRHDLLRVQVDRGGGLFLRAVDGDPLVHAEQAPEGLSGAGVTGYLTSLAARVDVQGGPVLALATGLGERRDQFALAIHHLAVDVVSWGIVLEDLLRCVADPEVDLPPTSMPFPAWTAELKRYAEEGGFRPQLHHWTGLARDAAAAGDLFPRRQLRRRETAAEVVRWTKGEADPLLGAARELYGLGPAETVLAVVARALARWTGQHRILFTLEGHGRERFAGDRDLTRTVGWFTSTFPHLIEVEPGVEDTFESVRRSFARLPDKGFGFGPLLRLDPGLGADRALLAGVRPQISFNYLGDQDADARGVEVSHLPADVTVDEDYPTPHLLDLVASRRRGEVLVEMLYPQDWRVTRALDGALTTAWCEVSDALRSVRARGFRTSSSIRADVIGDILVDVTGGGRA